MNTFVVGQKVWKCSGDYRLPGTVRSGFLTNSGAARFVVEHGNGILHIYNKQQIAPYSHDYPYLALLQETSLGHTADMRNGYCYRHGPAALQFNLQDGFPLLTTKLVNIKAVAAELMMFVHGATNIDYLHQHGVGIWDQWADANGELGPIYGAQWRRWQGPDGQMIDQLAAAQALLIADPFSRRNVINSWNVAAIPSMALPPCHAMFQLVVAADGEHLDLVLFQRSADLFVGVPFNIASYAMLLTMLCSVEGVGLKPGTLHMQFGDVHLYEEHHAAALEQLSRKPKENPTFALPPVKNVWDFTVDDLVAGLRDYAPHPFIRVPVMK